MLVRSGSDSYMISDFNFQALASSLSMSVISFSFRIGCGASCSSFSNVSRYESVRIFMFTLKSFDFSRSRISSKEGFSTMSVMTCVSGSDNTSPYLTRSSLGIPRLAVSYEKMVFSIASNAFLNTSLLQRLSELDTEYIESSERGYCSKAWNTASPDPHGFSLQSRRCWMAKCRETGKPSFLTTSVT